MDNKLDITLKVLKFFVILLIIFVGIKKQLEGLSLSETFFFYIFPFLAIYFFLSFLIYIKSREKKIMGLITFFSILFSLLTFEAFITYKILDKKTNQKIAAKTNNIKYESKNIISYLSDLNKTVTAFPFFRANLKYFDDKDLIPLGFFPNTITVGSKESGAFYTYKTDRYGFNNPDDVWDIEGKSILLIGDSFTLGTLPNKRNFADIIRKKYTKLINLGIGGNGPLKNYATLVEFIKISNPEYIFWLNYDGNDFEDLNEEIDSNILKKYIGDETFSQNLAFKSPEVEKLLKLYYYRNIEKFYKNKSKTTISRILNKNRIIDIVKLSNIRKLLGLTRSNSIENINYEIFYKLIFKASELSKQFESKFYFVNIPSAYSFSSKQNRLNTSERFNKIQRKLTEEKIKYLNFDEKLNRENFEDFFMYGKNGGHLSELGNKILGEQMIDKIINQ